ncbi:hypothetical protein ACFS07_04730 [Undibacterium arcticum]
MTAIAARFFLQVFVLLDAAVIGRTDADKVAQEGQSAVGRQPQAQQRQQGRTE